MADITAGKGSIDKSIGAQIKSARENAKLQIADVATRLNIEPQVLEDIEAGQRRASADQLFSFAQLYHVAIGYFYVVL